MPQRSLAVLKQQRLPTVRRLDPSTTQHGAYVDDEGVFHYQHIDAASGTTATLLRFQLQYSAAEGLPYEPINKPWLFEFVPGSPGDLLLAQEGSCRILYASLPKQGTDSSDVFLFGSHTGVLLYKTHHGLYSSSGINLAKQQVHMTAQLGRHTSNCLAHCFSTYYKKDILLQMKDTCSFMQAAGTQAT